MRYAIIAAGEGSRLLQEGVAAPKPLVKVGGECLIDRLMRIFAANGATSISVVCRPDRQVEQHLRQRQQDYPQLHYIVRTPPSSMHSLYELSPLLEGEEPFVLTTVDTVFSESDFSRYLTALERGIGSGEIDGLMGVTDYVDDESPLYVSTDAQLHLQAFLDREDHPHYISGGIYGLTPRCLETLRACIARGESRMRNFQRALLADGLRLQAWPFGQVFDIDHVADIEKASQFLSL